MKTKNIFGNLFSVVLILTVLILTVLGCGALTELVLDDAWALNEIKAGDIIADDLDKYLAVQFKADTNVAEFTIGPDWGELSSQNPDGTYTFEVDSQNNQIDFKKDGTTEHTVTYEFDSGLNEMEWTEWIDVGADVEIVGDDATIKYILFERAEE
ncbi:MAG: hypothetical protein ACLFRY_08865 [Spirochaetia bacterium]